MIDNGINREGGALNGGGCTFDGPFLSLLDVIGWRWYDPDSLRLECLEETAREGSLKEAAKGFILDLLVGIFCYSHGISKPYLRCPKEGVNKLFQLGRIGQTWH